MNEEEKQKDEEEKKKKEVKAEIKSSRQARIYLVEQTWKTIDYIRSEFPSFSHAEVMGTLQMVQNDLYTEARQVDGGVYEEIEDEDDEYLPT